MAGGRLQAALPRGQLEQLLDEVVLTRGRLLEGRWIKSVPARPPSTVVVAADLARLDLEDEEAAVWVGDDEVRLAFDLVAAVARDPSDVRQDDDALGEGASDPFERPAARPFGRRTRQGLSSAPSSRSVIALNWRPRRSARCRAC